MVGQRPGTQRNGGRSVTQFPQRTRKISQKYISQISLDLHFLGEPVISSPQTASCNYILSQTFSVHKNVAPLRPPVSVSHTRPPACRRRRCHPLTRSALSTSVFDYTHHSSKAIDKFPNFHLTKPTKSACEVGSTTGAV